jgi:hypothetical protein
MASNIQEFDSKHGFSVDQTTVVDSFRNAKDINSLEIKNRNYDDSFASYYILRGLNTSILALDDTGTQIILPSNSVSFITATILAVNEVGTAVYHAKLESSAQTDFGGISTVLSSMTTVIKDNIPSGQTWNIVPFVGGGSNRFSYSTTRAGTTLGIKWVVYAKVVNIEFQ